MFDVKSKRIMCHLKLIGRGKSVTDLVSLVDHKVLENRRLRQLLWLQANSLCLSSVLILERDLCWSFFLPVIYVKNEVSERVVHEQANSSERSAAVRRWAGSEALEWTLMPSTGMIVSQIKLLLLKRIRISNCCSCVEKYSKVITEYFIPKKPYLYSQELFEAVARTEKTEDWKMVFWEDRRIQYLQGKILLIWEFLGCFSRMWNEYEPDDVVC